MTNAGKAVVFGGIGLGIYAFSSGSGKKTNGTRPRWRTQIPTVPNDVPWATVDEAICQCYQAGETESVELVNCVLLRIWPDVPWPHRAGDHLSVLRVWQAVGARVATFIALPEAERAAACAEVPPPPPPGGDEDDEVQIIDWFGDAPSKFTTITQQHNQNPSRAVENAYGLPMNGPNTGRALVCMANSGFNLLFYSRWRNAGAFGSASVVTRSGDRKNVDIGPAWFPWNNRVITAATTGAKLRRQVGWGGSGPVAGGDRAYGSPWKPPTVMTPQGILVCTNADPWSAENNPPPEVLAKLGWGLDEMKQVWLNGNP